MEKDYLFDGEQNISKKEQLKINNAKAKRIKEKRANGNVLIRREDVV